MKQANQFLSVLLALLVLLSCCASAQAQGLSRLLARVTRTVTATVDGINAQVVFAGLAPNFVGLYQINVQIPSGVGSGEVNLVLTQDGIESNTVTVFVRQ